MKLKTIALLSCILFAANVGAENDGSKSKPYTVAEVKSMSKLTYTTISDKWVKGVIYGIMKDDKTVTASDITHSQNIVLGDAEVNIPIKLTESSVRSAINLKEHRYLQGKNLLIRGDLSAYYSLPAMVSPSQYVITYDISINKYGYATLYLDMPYTMPEGSTAYYCTTSGEVARLLPIEGVVPAHTGVIIEAAPNTTCTLTYSTSANPAAESIKSDNQLIGYTEDTEVTFEDYSYYALNASKDGKVGFYIPKTATETSFTAKAYKAYLQVPKGQGASMFVIQRADDETQIIPMTTTTDDVTYDLQGRRVAHPTAGIYIKGGKKIVIR